jgi:uncharacterized membrane protein YphA (DoxX/SURF4 family)
MTILAIASQIIIALGIFNVWIVRRDRATGYRPAGAENIREEFKSYGLPDWVRVAVGSTKIALAVLLLVGIVAPTVALVAAGVMAPLMLGAVGAHIKVGDPIMKSVPALTMLALSLVVVVGQLP